MKQETEDLLLKLVLNYCGDCGRGDAPEILKDHIKQYGTDLFVDIVEALEDRVHLTNKCLETLCIVARYIKHEDSHDDRRKFLRQYCYLIGGWE